MAAPSCPSVPELREALAKAEAQHADNQDSIVNGEGSGSNGCGFVFNCSSPLASISFSMV